MASDLFGQLNESDAADYSASGSNDSPNPQGFGTGPDKAAIDSTNHRLFVADPTNNRVMVFQLNSSNQVSSRTAVAVLGQPDFRTVSSGTTAAKLSSPRGLTVDTSSSRLFVADSSNNRVVIFDVATVTNGESAVSVLGQTSFTNSSSGLSQSSLSLPYDAIYWPASSSVFVADSSNNRVLMFNVASVSNGENATHVLGQANFTSGGSAVTQAGMSSPKGLSLDTATKTLFVSNCNARVTTYDVTGITDGENAVNVLGEALFTTCSGGVASSTNISGSSATAYDESGKRFFVFDDGASRVMVFDVTAISNGEAAVNVLGKSDLSTGGSGTSQSLINSPKGGVYDATSQQIFTTDTGNNRVLVWDVAAITDGESAIDAFGQLDESDQPYYTSATANNVRNSRGFSSPRHLALDSVNHRLFVVDSGNARILAFNLDSSDNTTNRLADFVLGQGNIKDANTGTTQSRFSNNPEAIAYDPVNQRLFVGDTNNKRVLVFDASALSTGMNASYVLGQTDFTTGTGGTTQTKLESVRGLHYDTSGNRLFVADGANNRVMVWDFDVYPLANGASAAYVLGQANFTSSSAATTQTGTDFPMAVAFDSSGNRLFASELNNNRVMVWDFDVYPLANGASAAYVLGQANFTSSAAATTQSGMNSPGGLAYDSGSETLFVAAEGNTRVTAFDTVQLSNGENAVGVFGPDDFTSGYAGPVDQTDLAAPRGIVFDGTNRRLYVSDYSNNRVMVFNLVRITTTSLPAVTVGYTYSQTISSTNSQGTVARELLSGSLPPGLVLGSVTGTPTTAGSYTFAVRASDSNGSIGTFWDDQSYTLEVFNPNVSGGGALPTPTPSPTPGVSPSPTPGVSPSPTPYASPLPTTLPLVVTANPLTASPGQAVTFTATGGNNVYSWYAGGGSPLSGNGTPFISSFNTSGSKTVRVDSGAAFATITVNILTPSPSPLPPPSPAPSPAPSVSPGPTPVPSLLPGPSVSPPPPPPVPVREVPGGLEGLRDYLGRAVPVTAPLAIAATILAMTTAFLSVLAAGSFFGNMSLYFQYFRQYLLEMFGLKKKVSPWGTAYDSRTKQPLPFARVELLDETSRVLESRITDSAGRYGFLVSSESLAGPTRVIQLKAFKPGYTFPSRVVTTIEDTVLYAPVYLGGMYTIDVQKPVSFDIPLDPFKDEAVRFPSAHPRAVALMDLGFWLGLIAVPLNYIIVPSVFHLLVLLLFVAANIPRLIGLWQRPYGTVIDTATGKPLPFALMTLNDMSGRRASFTVSDERGRYIMFALKGNYTLLVYTPASYVPGRTVPVPVAERGGWITREIRI